MVFETKDSNATVFFVFWRLQPLLIVQFKMAFENRAESARMVLHVSCKALEWGTLLK
jgi:hypothetical protein